MLPKENRLKKKKDFERVIKKGKFFRDDFLVLKKIKNDLPLTRVGFIVSQKVSKKAVLRNKVKRKLREVVRASLGKIKSGYDVIFFTRKGIEEKEFAELKNSVEGLLKKARLLQDSCRKQDY